jgi:hypothetical protein
MYAGMNRNAISSLSWEFFVKSFIHPVFRWCFCHGTSSVSHHEFVRPLFTILESRFQVFSRLKSVFI